MALFGTNVCNSLFFQMKCDIYYAQEVQDKYGKIDKSWNFDMVEDCSLYTMNDRSNSNNFTFEDDRFFKLETMLFGRFKTDPRQGSDGQYHPLSHILITNIRSGTECSDEIFFVEPSEGYQPTPTIYEIKTCQPYIGPFNTVEYWKVQLERSDFQELNDIDIS